MENYKCQICGKKHPVFRGIENPLPAVLRDIPEAEWPGRVLDNDGRLFILDKKYAIISAYIQVFHQADTQSAFFNWQVWVSVDVHEFVSKNALFEENKEVVIAGHLESELFFYDDIVGLEVELHIHPQAAFPTLKATQKSELKEDQDSPISTDRIEALMSRIHHREIYDAPLHFDQSFTTRLLAELKSCKAKYKKGGFILSVSSPGEVIFQILPARLLENTSRKQQGYGLHLAFDFEDESSLEEFERLKHSAEYTDKNFHEVDGVPIYQMYTGEDHQKLCEVSVYLIEAVFLNDPAQVAIDSFEIH